MRRSRINPVNSERAKQNREYIVLARAYLSSHYICEACAAKNATQIHHKGRRTGLWLTYVPFFMAVCCDCHTWIEHNGKEAEGLGWIKRIRVPFKDYLKTP